MSCTDLQVLIHETTMQWAKEGKVKNLTGATSMWQKELGSTELVGRPMRQVVSEAIVDVINDRNAKRKKLVVTRTATIAREARVEENTRAQLEAVLDLLVEENPGLPTPPARRKHLNEVVKKLREKLFDAKQELRDKQANARRIVSLKKQIKSKKVAVDDAKNPRNLPPQAVTKREAEKTPKVKELEEELAALQQELTLRNELKFAQDHNQDPFADKKKRPKELLSAEAIELDAQLQAEIDRVANLKQVDENAKKLQKQLEWLQDKVNVLQVAGELTPEQIESLKTINADKKTPKQKAAIIENLQAKIDTAKQEQSLLAQIRRMNLGLSPTEAKDKSTAPKTEFVQLLKKHRDNLSKEQQLMLQVEHLQRQLDTGQFEMPVTKKTEEATQEAAELAFRRDVLRKDVARSVRAIKKRSESMSVFDAGVDFINSAQGVVKAFWTAYEGSFLGKQGWATAIRHPIIYGSKLPEVLKAALPKVDLTFIHSKLAYKGGEQYMREKFQQLTGNPETAQWMDAGLKIYEMGGDMNAQSEQFASDFWHKKIPYTDLRVENLAIGIGASNRMYAHFLNEIRIAQMERLVRLMEAAGPVGKEDLQRAARHINIWTGEAGKAAYGLDQFIHHARIGIFAPSYTVSQFQALTEIGHIVASQATQFDVLKKRWIFGGRFHNLSESFVGDARDPVGQALQKEIGKELWNTIWRTSTLMGMLAFFYGDEEDDSFAVEVDTNSTSGLKVPKDNRTYDVLGGFAQPIVHLSRMMNWMYLGTDAGYKPTKIKGKAQPKLRLKRDGMTPHMNFGEAEYIRWGESGSPFNMDVQDEIQRFWFNKASPAASVAFMLYNNKRMYGRRPKPGEAGDVGAYRKLFAPGSEPPDHLWKDWSFWLENFAPVLSAFTYQQRAELGFTESYSREFIDTMLMIIGMSIYNSSNEEEESRRVGRGK